MIDLEKMLISKAQDRADRTDHPEILRRVSRTHSQVQTITQAKEVDAESVAIVGDQLEIRPFGGISRRGLVGVDSEQEARIEGRQISAEDPDE
jgi:hypothetical protein